MASSSSSSRSIGNEGMASLDPTLLDSIFDFLLIEELAVLSSTCKQWKHKIFKGRRPEIVPHFIPENGWKWTLFLIWSKWNNRRKPYVELLGRGTADDSLKAASIYHLSREYDNALAGWAALSPFQCTRGTCEFASTDTIRLLRRMAGWNDTTRVAGGKRKDLASARPQLSPSSKRTRSAGSTFAEASTACPTKSTETKGGLVPEGLRSEYFQARVREGNEMYYREFWSETVQEHMVRNKTGVKKGRVIVAFVDVEGDPGERLTRYDSSGRFPLVDKADKAIAVLKCLLPEEGSFQVEKINELLYLDLTGRRANDLIRDDAQGQPISQMDARALSVYGEELHAQIRDKSEHKHMDNVAAVIYLVAPHLYCTEAEGEEDSEGLAWVLFDKVPRPADNKKPVQSEWAALGFASCENVPCMMNNIDGCDEATQVTMLLCASCIRKLQLIGAIPSRCSRQACTNPACGETSCGGLRGTLTKLKDFIVQHHNWPPSNGEWETFTEEMYYLTEWLGLAQPLFPLGAEHADYDSSGSSSSQVH
uniref:F-box domain-containing protein n=1 Tax=Lotharella oceanica TaxID=641309 RepID=A0A7S2TT74_9EUKA|mmetsp:Transcript_26308/g.49128  ORF Transcript_26308/g.49128 Transcript_26308/m.49128 type:complete len:536 (+) Transcript_26308:1-1608(+)